MEKEYCVYVHTNKANGKKYVGITSMSPEKRWANGHGYRSNVLFYRAIQKYGWESFDHSIVLRDLSREEAYTAEIELISVFKSSNPRFGYNIDKGGNGSNRISETTRENLRKAGKVFAAEHPEAGVRLAEYAKTHKTEISLMQKEYNRQHPEKGERHSEWMKKYCADNPDAVRASREKCREYYEKHPEARKLKSEQTKRYFDEHPEAREHAARKTKEYYQNPEVKIWKSEERKRFFAEHPEKKTTKAVAQFYEDGTFIAEFVSAREAETKTGVSYKKISAVVTGKQKTAGGYIWRYSNELQNHWDSIQR